MRRIKLVENDPKQTQMTVMVSHPTGNANLREVVRAFDESEILAEFNTCIAIDKKSLSLKFLTASLRNEFLRREFPIGASKIKTHAFRELMRLGFARFGLNYFTRHEIGAFSVDSIYRSFDRAVSNRLPRLLKTKGVTSVYAYEDGALNTFREARHLGLNCYYDLPIGYWRSARKLLGAAAEKSPAWASTMSGFRDSESKLKRKDDFNERRKHLANLTEKELEAKFWELAEKVVDPLVDLSEKNTSPSIERSVLMRMGFSSIESTAIVEGVQDRG